MALVPACRPACLPTRTSARTPENRPVSSRTATRPRSQASNSTAASAGMAFAHRPADRVQGTSGWSLRSNTEAKAGQRTPAPPAWRDPGEQDSIAFPCHDLAQTVVADQALAVRSCPVPPRTMQLQGRPTAIQACSADHSSRTTLQYAAATSTGRSVLLGSLAFRLARDVPAVDANKIHGDVNLQARLAISCRSIPTTPVQLPGCSPLNRNPGTQCHTISRSFAEPATVGAHRFLLVEPVGVFNVVAQLCYDLRLAPEAGDVPKKVLSCRGFVQAVHGTMANLPAIITSQGPGEFR